jgi:SAM-dependent methyltransferase
VLYDIKYAVIWIGQDPGDTLAQFESRDGTCLTSAPTNFFMTIRDIGFWIRCARTDSRLRRLRHSLAATTAFDELYATTGDPYGAELPQYRYQQRKYTSLLSMLPRQPYRSVLDIGCGLGTFARMLAPFAGRVHGTDMSSEAIQQARKRSTAHPNIVYSQRDMLEEPSTDESFDLIVLADTLYYVEPLTEARLKRIAAGLAEKLAPAGLLLLVNHFFFGIDSSSRTTRNIHNVFCSESALEPLAEHRRAFFLATLLRRTSAA